MTIDRDDADCRLRRAVRLGLRRRQSVCADPPVRHAGRPARGSSIAPTRGARASSSTSSTTTSVRTAITCTTSRRTTSPTGTRTTGAGRSTSRDRRRRARVLRRERRLLDRRVPLRRAAARRDPGHQGRFAGARDRGDRRRRAREAAGRRPIYIVAENEPQDTRLVRPPDAGGYGLDALWNDDYHHTAIVALTGRREAYYTDYTGIAAGVRVEREVRLPLSGAVVRLAEAAARHAGARSSGRRFVTFLENHDQVANSAYGKRLHQLSSPGRLSRADRVDAARSRDADALSGPGVRRRRRRSCFSPITTKELAADVATGRGEFLAQFPSIADPDIQASLPPPGAEARSRVASWICPSESVTREVYALHRDLLRCGETDPAFRARRDGASTARCSRRPSSSALRAGMTATTPADRQPRCRSDAGARARAVAGAADRVRWVLQWSSEAAAVRRERRAPLVPEGPWHVPGESALLLGPEIAAARRTSSGADRRRARRS